MLSATKPEAIFCDRDGTLIHDEHFLHDPNQIRWVAGVLEQFSQLTKQGTQVVVITNQSGVARGYFDIESVHAIHTRLQADAQTAGGEILDFYYCPHHPEGQVGLYQKICNCRKPAPGMFLQAIQDHGLQPSRCWVVGDRIRDLEPGLNLGMKAFLVETGYGLQEQSIRANHPAAEAISIIPSLADLFSNALKY